MKYWCCDPASDPTRWFEVDEFDMDDAAATFAKESCSRDDGDYALYKYGHEVMVWDGQSMEAVEVTMDFVPRFSAGTRTDTEPTDEMLRSAREASET